MHLLLVHQSGGCLLFVRLVVAICLVRLQLLARLLLLLLLLVAFGLVAGRRVSPLARGPISARRAARRLPHLGRAASGSSLASAPAARLSLVVVVPVVVVVVVLLLLGRRVQRWLRAALLASRRPLHLSAGLLGLSLSLSLSLSLGLLLILAPLLGRPRLAAPSSRLLLLVVALALVAVHCERAHGNARRSWAHSASPRFPFPSPKATSALLQPPPSWRSGVLRLCCNGCYRRCG